MAYVPLNLEVYAAAYAGAIAGIGVPDGAFIVNPNQSHYTPVTVVAAAFAQAFDTAWGALPVASLYDIEAIAEACCNTFVKGPGAPMSGDVTTQTNWTVTATAIVALIKEGGAAAGGGGIIFPPFGGGGPVPQQYWVASSWGSDVTGTGSIFNPFQTIAHTQGIITDASLVKIYEIILYPGNYEEDVAVKAFIEIVGFDPTQSLSRTYPAVISGTITLGTGYAAALATGWLTNLDIDGTTDLNFIEELGGADAAFSITNCQLEDNLTANMAAGNTIELHGSTLLGNYTQTGGNAVWENTAGARDPTLGTATLTVEAASGTAGQLTMYDSAWRGNIHADQNAVSTEGLIVHIDMFNSEVQDGTCTITSVLTNVPTINAGYGCLPENPVLEGSASVELSPQMRVSQGLVVPAATEILADTVQDVLIPLAGSVLGGTSIETMSCTFTPISSEWGTQLAANDCTWSFYVDQNGTTSEVHVCIYNASDSTVTVTGGGLPFIFYAFPPNVIGV
jgi:hypothetical protein